MSLWSELRYLARRLDRRRAERELEDELAVHLELEIERNLAAGQSPDEARRAARRKLGNLGIAREDARGVWQLHGVETFLRDLRHAARVLRARPAYSLTAVLSLAIGIGVCTAVWSVVDGVVLRPLPYPEADRIVELRELDETRRPMPFTEPNYLDVREQSGSFEALAQYGSNIVTVTGGTQPARVRMAWVGRDFFRVFRVEPARGRAFLAAESVPGGPPVAVVGAGFWRRVLGGRPELGRVRIDGAAYTVIGVMPAGFDAPDGADVWIPRERLPTDISRTAHNWSVVGRLRSGVTLAQAAADVSAVARQLARRHGQGTHAADMATYRLQDYIVGDAERALWILLGAVGLLLVIALANTANLMLAQAAARRNELAVRAALGATRGRLARQLVTEALLLAGLGAALGVPLAAAGVELLLALDPAALPRAGAIHTDARALAFTSILALLVAVLLGTLTALRGAGPDLHGAVADAGRRQTGGPAGAVLRRWFVLVQVALAFTLLIGAGLLAQSFARLVAVDPGFEHTSVVAMELSVPVPPPDEADTRRLIAFFEGKPGAAAPVDDPNDERVRAFYARLLERVRALPGVAVVGAANALPMSGSGADGMFLIDNDRTRTGTAEYRLASADYFAAMHIPLLEGRLFATADTARAPHVAVVSQSLARRTWPKGDAIGQRIQFGNMDGDLRTMTVVGVVGDVRDRGLDAGVRPTVYGNALQRPPPSAMSLVVRAAGDPTALVPAMRAAVQELDPELPADFRTLDDIVASSLDGRRFALVLLGVFAVVALLLAVTGIYGVTAYSVAQRTHEFGIRMALGARPRTVLAMVMREAARLALGGVAIGALAALALTRLIASWLVGVGASDPATFALVALALAAAALLASWVPARRAVRVDPMAALRSE